MAQTTITVPTADYEDHDDCLAAAEADYIADQMAKGAI